MARTTPLVQHGVLHLAGATRAPVTVGSAAWYAWLDRASSFVFAQGAARFTAHKERFQRGGWYWRAYRRHDGMLRRVYLGKTEALTQQHLAAALDRICGEAGNRAPKLAAAEPPPRRMAAGAAQVHGNAPHTPGAAIRHAIDNRDAPAAARLIEAHAVEWFGRGEAPQVSLWIEALPPALLSERPRLLLVYVRARLLAGSWEGIEGRLRALDAGDGAEAGVLRALNALLGGHIDESARLAQLAAATIEPSDVLLYSMNAMTQAAAAWARGETQSALRQVSGARKAGNIAQYTDVALIALSHEALFLMRSGRLHAAQARYSRVLDTADHSAQRDLPATGMAALGLGRLLYERNLLPEAGAQMQRAIEYGRRRENTAMVIGGLAGLARVLQAQGASTEASALLDEAEQLVLRGAPEQLALIVVSGRAWLALALGDAAAAAACLERYDLYDNGYLAAQAESAQLALAHTRLQQQRPSDALAVLAPLRRAAEQSERRGSLLGLLVAEALAHNAQGRPDEAVAVLRAVLPYARDEGYVRSFVDAGPALVELLRRAQRSNAGAYVDTLLAAFNAGSVEPAALGQAVETLTRRELDVLRLVAAGASNDEIAAQLSFSASNVKKRLHSVFRKLNVKRRTQAVARAREQGLI